MENLLIAARNYTDAPSSDRAAVLAYWALKLVKGRLDSEAAEKLLWDIADLLGR